MSLELNQVAQQVKAMGHSLAQQKDQKIELLQRAHELLASAVEQQSDLPEYIRQAEKVAEKLRFDWVGAAPTGEPLSQTFSLPECPAQLTVIASDGSQIYPDQHAISLYYLINTGGIVFRHGSNQKPYIFNGNPILCYTPDDLFDEQGRLVSASEINVQRDLAELKLLSNLLPAREPDPVLALMDGQLTLRVIDLPYHRQRQVQDAYIELLSTIREANALLAGYIDGPRSSFVLSLLHLVSLAPANISSESVNLNPFRHLTDAELFQFLGPGERSAIFRTRAKGLEKYDQTGHSIHFFYLNVSANPAVPVIARIEIPAWVAAHPPSLNMLHAGIVRQALVTGNYPYVLARADELAVISSEEREAVELMLAVEMRRCGLTPQISSKQKNKNAFRANKESFQL
jgi:hypothetical protein